MREGLQAYLGAAGRLMYLGGNGFYWVTSTHPEHPTVIEVRRGQAGTRSWESQPGESYHSTTGELGGLWRHRGKGPNALVGIGFAAQGGGSSPGYARLPSSDDARAAFIFDQIGQEEIGDFGLVLGGAAGDELDSADRTSSAGDKGAPPHLLILATSIGRHSDQYLVAHEEMLISRHDVGGRANPKVGADMVFFETASGGAVFSVGSINWMGSLSHDEYANNVSRITANVLNRFLDPTRFEMPKTTTRAEHATPDSGSPPPSS
jgi:N,N-dimethylformamidase